MKRNCPNCSAPYDVSLNKCPYCGTSYFDMSAIDFRNRTPIFLKIRIDNMVITQKVVPELGSITMNYDDNDDVDIDVIGRQYASFRHSMNMNTDISFRAISTDGVLCTIDQDEV